MPAVLAIAEEEEAPVTVIGRVRGDRLVIGIEGEDAIDLPAERLHATWSGALERLLGAVPAPPGGGGASGERSERKPGKGR